MSSSPLPLRLQVLHGLTLAVIIIGLVLFGGVYRPLWLMGTAIFCGLLAFMTAYRITCLSDPESTASSLWVILKQHRMLVLGYILVLVWAFVQTSPFTPISWHHPVWKDNKVLLQNLSDTYGIRDGFPPPPKNYGSISLNVAETWNGIIRFVGFGLALWLGTLLGQNVRLLRRSLLVVVVVTVAIAVYGLIAHLGDIPYILWQPKRFHPESLTATFLNRNHTAALFGIAIQAALAWLWSRDGGSVTKPLQHSQFGRKTSKTPKAELKDTMGWRRRWLAATEQFLRRDWQWLLVFVVLGTALFLTQSRAGLFTSVGGILCLFFGAAGLKILKSKAAIRNILLVLALGGLLYITSSRGVVDRLGMVEANAETRGSIFALTLEAMQDHSILGTGGNTFSEVFRLYRTVDFLDFLSESHNEYLESMLTFGIPAAIVLFLTLSLLPISFVQGMLRRRQYKIFPLLGASLCLQLALHSLVDFPLEIPALTWLVMFLMGGCLAQCHSSKTKSG